MGQRELNTVKNMFPGDIGAYRRGINDCISLLEELLETGSGELIVHLDNMGDRQEGLTIDVLKMFSNFNDSMDELSKTTDITCEVYMDFLNKAIQNTNGEDDG